jgi:hypothetical protein
METRRVNNAAKINKGALVSFARTIGTALGTVAAKTEKLTKTPRGQKLNRKPRSKATKARKRNKA